jgi:hypothetical protein
LSLVDIVGAWSVSTLVTSSEIRPTVSAVLFCHKDSSSGRCKPLLLYQMLNHLVSVVSCQKLYTNREQLSHVYKGVTVGTDKFQVTPLSQVCICVCTCSTNIKFQPIRSLKRSAAANLVATLHVSCMATQEVLIVWGEDDQLFPVEKAFAVQRYKCITCHKQEL